MGRTVALYKALEQRISWTRLFEGDWEGQLSGEFRNFDDLFGDDTPAPANAGAGHHTFPRRPATLRCLHFQQHFPQKLLGKVSPEGTAVALGGGRVGGILDDPVRPEPHLVDYAGYRHISVESLSSGIWGLGIKAVKWLCLVMV